MESGEVIESCELPKLKLEATKPALHEAILPGFARCAATELYLQPRAQITVLVAQVFTPLVTV